MTTWAMLDGFEHGRNGTGASGVYDNASGSPTIVTSPVRTGARALEIATVNAAERVGYNPPSSTRVCMMVFAIRFESLPGANCVLAHWTDANGSGQLRFNAATNRFRASVNNVNNADFGPNPIATATWYLIVAEFDSSGASAAFRAKCYNASTGAIIGSEGSVTRVQTAADITAVMLGSLETTTTQTVYYDDWGISYTDGDYEAFTDIPWGIESLIPSSDGTHNITTSGDFDSFTGTAFSNATTTGAAFVGHRPLQAANTADQVIRQELGTVANYMEFLLEDLSSNLGNPLAVRTYGTHVESSATGASLAEERLLLADDTEILTTGSLSMIDTTEDPGTTVTIRKRMAIAPSGGWDRDRVNGLKARVGFGDNAPDVNFIDFMVEVLLGPKTNADATPSTLASVAAFPSPSPTAAADATPSTLTADAAFPSPSPTANAGATPSTLLGEAAFPTPDIYAESGADATPSTLEGVAAFPSASPVADAGASAATLEAVADFPTPSPTADAGATPSTLAGEAAFPTPTPAADAGATPSTLGSEAAFPQATVTADANAIPATVTGEASFPTPTPEGAGEATPGVLEAVAAFPPATVMLDAEALAGVLEAIAAFPDVTVQADANATPEVLEGTAFLWEPTIEVSSPPVILGPLRARVDVVIEATVSNGHGVQAGGVHGAEVAPARRRART